MNCGVLDVIDAEAGGDVGRVVLSGLEAIPGASVADRAHYLREVHDDLRLAFMRAPHGDRSHSINLLVPATLGSEANFGLIIMGTMGYPGFSGSNVMCTVAALNLSGQLPATRQKHTVRLETPVGTTPLEVSRAPGQPITVEYAAPAGRVLSQGLSAPLGQRGAMDYDLVDSGVPYVVVDADTAALDPRAATPERLSRLFDPLLDHASNRRYKESDSSQPVTLGLLTEPVSDFSAARGDRTVDVNVAVYMAGGVMCSGPTGTGTTALVTWLHARRPIGAGDSIRAVSPTGNTFGATLLQTSRSSKGAALVHTKITGSPTVLGRHCVNISQ